MVGGDSAGGSFELARLIDEYGEFLISDLSVYHGIKPWQIIDGSYSPRALLAYIKNLPLDSATVSAIRGGPEFRNWNANMYMLANLVDAVNHNTYVLTAANSSKKKPKQPEPVKRPDAKKPKSNGGLFAHMARTAFNAQTKKGS